MQTQLPTVYSQEGEAPKNDEAPVGGPSKVLRYGVVLPMAACLTLGLTLSMAGLIATEFSPQDKTETASYEINPRVDDISEPKRAKKPDALKEVETPPPPPTVATYETAAVSQPIIELVGKTMDFDPDSLDLGLAYKVVSIQKEVTPIFRIPPVFPARFMQGNVSGYCRVRLAVSPAGKPFNVEITLCTNDQLRKPTIRSVQKWNYAPQVEDGRPVSRTGLETTIRFDLTGEDGKVLPLPSGY